MHLLYYLNKYCNGPKFSDRRVLENSVDPAHEQSNQGRQCLSFCLQCLDALVYSKTL